MRSCWKPAPSTGICGRRTSARKTRCKGGCQMYGTLKKIFAFAGSKKGLLKKSLLFSFLSGLFSAMQFAALFVVIGAVVSDNRDGKFICISLGIMAVSLIGRIITTYFSTMEQTETGYCMVAEKRIHIGDRLRYIPMGYFNKNSIGNITAIVTTTLGDVENSAARVLVSVLGGFFNSVALVIVLLVFDWRIGLVAAAVLENTSFIIVQNSFRCRKVNNRHIYKYI